MKPTRLLYLLLFSFLLTGCSFSLAADVTPPPDYRPPVEAQPEATTGPLYPIVPPDPANGAPIYTEKCAPCHGNTGTGGGERSAQLPTPPPAIGSAEVARQSTPAEWYAIVTQGNIEKLMPPFASLTDQERWDVVAYVYTLSAPQELVTLGQAVFQANCTGCHGESGRGDGVRAGSLSVPPADFTDQSFMAGRSTASLFAAITSGKSPMPAFGEDLTEDERWAVTAYLRSLTFAATMGSSTPATLAPDAEATPRIAAAPTVTSAITATTNAAITAAVVTPGVGVISGQVINGSGTELSSDLSVILYAFDEMNQVFTETMPIGANGYYTFTDVEWTPDRAFITTVEYGPVTYGSDVVVAQDDANQLTLPVTIYDSTTDQSGLAVDRLHVFLEFSEPGFVRVGELFIISNPGLRTVAATELGGPVVQFSLPEGAQNLQFQSGALGERYIAIPGGFADTSPVQPSLGEYQVLFTFDMPYDRKLTISQPMLPNTGDVVLLMPDTGVKLQGNLLTDSGARDVQGVSYLMYTGSGFGPDTPLTITISGDPQTGSPSLSGADNRTSLLVGLGALGVALIVAGLWLYRRSRAMTPVVEAVPVEKSEPLAPAEDPDTLMDAIIALDDQFRDGKLPEAAYQERRAELKEKLRYTSTQVNK